MERNFEKEIPGIGKITVTIGAPALNQYDKIIVGYRIDGSVRDSNEYNPDGYYLGQYTDGILRINSDALKIKGKKVTGLKLPDGMTTEINSEITALLDARNQIYEDTIDALVSGSMPINFSLVGCDLVHYQAWLRPCPIAGQEQKLMEEATKRMLRASGIDPLSDINMGNICDFLGTPTPTKELPLHGTDPQHDNKSLEYHGFVSEIISSYNVALPDLLRDKIAKAKAKKEARTAHRAYKIAQAKTVGKPVVLYSYMAECNDRNEECSFDRVNVMIDATGKETERRIHAY